MLAFRRGWHLVPVRLAVGVAFLSHGLAKWSRGPEKFAGLLHYIGAPLPVPTAWAVTLLEIGGGLALLAGAFVAITAVPLIGTMLVIHIAALLALRTREPTAASIDAWLARRRLAAPPPR